MKRPTPAQLAEKWKRCKVCHQPSPFLIYHRVHGFNASCIPCYEKAKAEQPKGAA